MALPLQAAKQFQSLYRMFLGTDATQVEINPLAIAYVKGGPKKGMWDGKGQAVVLRPCRPPLSHLHLLVVMSVTCPQCTLWTRS